MLPTLKQLQHFVAIADTGQISKAAQRCHVTQSSMTASLKGLESTVGATLFTRHAGGLRLTDAGARFLRHAQQIESGLHDAMESVALRVSSASGPLHIGVTETISAYVLSPLIRALEKKFPDLEPSFSELKRADIEDDINTGKLEMALLLASNFPDDKSLSCEPLIRSPRQLWGHPEHPLMNANRVSLDQVAKQRYILLDMDEHVSTVEKYWNHYGLQPNLGYRSSSIEAVRSLVAAGQGVTILSDLVYRPWSLDGHRIVRRQLIDAVPSMDVGLVWDPGRPHSGNFFEVKDYLMASFKELMRR
ncbi:LysR family transcriptional regulator [Pseudomonas sp. MWU16-30317]|uniref:LysR family transcriptional regulator n=1 Tax=Pseudomonas sp. MWU16-30317 TaxID=2878095 RepID=UPI001CF937ED|nr:LysR family transcriptional regulator [Pseudomonas sp. MWU16-30317]